MPATLVWGKSFYIDEHGDVFGVDGGCDFLSWASITAMTELAHQHGVAMDLWPIYDCQVESKIPIEEVPTRAQPLREALEAIPSESVDKDYWLSFVSRLLRQGHAFFIMP